MKDLIITIIFAFLQTSVLYGQEIEPVPEGKSVVYFVRPSSAGFAINFRYFDSTQFIGKFNAPKYIRYECEPGNHLFWAKAENADFIQAELEVGKIYFIEAVPMMGAMKARVKLLPVNPKDSKKMNKIKKLMIKKPSESFSKIELEAEATKTEGLFDVSIKKYKKKNEKGKEIMKLEKSMYYEL